MSPKTGQSDSKAKKSQDLVWWGDIYNKSFSTLDIDVVTAILFVSYSRDL